MKRRTLSLALAGAVVAAGVPFLVTVKAWPEIVVPAYFMSRGGVLYETIFFPHTPLLISVLAAAGGLLGFSGMLFRSVVAVAMASTAILVVLGIERRRGFSAAAAAGVLLSILWLSYMDGLAVWPDPLLAPVVLAAALLLERYERLDSASDLRAAGLLLGIAILVKQTSAWIALASLLWMLWRRKSLRAIGALVLTVALPYVAFAVLWAVAYRTTSHITWTLILPIFSPMGREIRSSPTPDDVHESLAPFLALLALFLLEHGLKSRRRSPMAFLAVGTVGMAWPRVGLLHLSASAGVVSVLAARSLLAAREFFERGRREKFSMSRLVASAGGVSLLVIALGVAVLGGGSLLADGWGGRVFYWDDAYTTDLLGQVREHLTPDRRIYLFNVPRDNLYARANALTPDGLYVNSSFWYCLDRDRVDERVTNGLRGFPGWILYQDVPETSTELKKTALYRFLSLHASVRDRIDSNLSWRTLDGGAR